LERLFSSSAVRLCNCVNLSLRVNMNENSLSHIISELGVIESNNLFAVGSPGLGLYHREAAAGIPNHVPVAGTCRVPAAAGKVKWNVAPRPLFAVAHKRPPCDSTMERLIARPIPDPCALVVKKAL